MTTVKITCYTPFIASEWEGRYESGLAIEGCLLELDRIGGATFSLPKTRMTIRSGHCFRRNGSLAVGHGIESPVRSGWLPGDVRKAKRGWFARARSRVGGASEAGER